MNRLEKLKECLAIAQKHKNPDMEANIKLAIERRTEKILAMIFIQIPQMIELALKLKTDKNYICLKNEFYSSNR